MFIVKHRNQLHSGGNLLNVYSHYAGFLGNTLDVLERFRILSCIYIYTFVCVNYLYLPKVLESIH